MSTGSVNDGERQVTPGLEVMGDKHHQARQGDASVLPSCRPRHQQLEAGPLRMAVAEEESRLQRTRN